AGDAVFGADRNLRRRGVRQQVAGGGAGHLHHLHGSDAGRPVQHAVDGVAADGALLCRRAAVPFLAARRAGARAAVSCPPRSASSSRARGPAGRIVRRLKPRYGPSQPPRVLDPLGELVFTILSQSTADTNSVPAFEALVARFDGDWEAVRGARVP